MRDLDLFPTELIASPTTFDVVLHHRSVFSPKDEEWPKNSGRSPTQVLHETQEAATRTVGINAHSGKLENLDAAGIIDPACVLCQALRIAWSHTRELLLTGAWDLTPPSPAGRENAQNV